MPTRTKQTSAKSANQNECIQVRGACTHNLKSVDVDIQRNKLTVITGVSGSGKSSLAFDTIFAEGQRQYIDTLSAYARRFFQQLPRPDVESITGLQPTLCIDQKQSSLNPRSTVGQSRRSTIICDCYWPDWDGALLSVRYTHQTAVRRFHHFNA